MTSAQVLETSVTNNSSFQNYLHPDDHTIRTTDTPGFKPFTMLNNTIIICHVNVNGARKVSLQSSVFLYPTTSFPGLFPQAFPKHCYVFRLSSPKGLDTYHQRHPVTKRKFGIFKMSCTRFRGRTQKSSKNLFNV